MAQVFNADLFTPHAAQSSYYSDFFTNFTAHPDLGDLVIKKNEDAVKQAIRNLLMTNKYERPFQPSFGGNIRNYLFEPMSAVTQSGLQEEITSVITNYEPRVRLISVVVTPYVEQNAYAITITFYILNITTPVTLQTILYRVR
jgi:phage baseplate assembly protein W